MADLRQIRPPRAREPWQSVIVYAVTIPVGVFTYANAERILDFVRPPTAQFVTAVSASAWTGNVTATAIGFLVLIAPFVTALWILRRALGSPARDLSR